MTKDKIKEKLFELEEKNEIEYDISHRGGTYGLARDDAFDLLEIPEEDRIAEHYPPKIGVYCNYLGGGLRGSVSCGGYSKDVPEKTAEKMELFCIACRERYEEIEKRWSEDPEAFTDEWNEEGTKRCRDNGIVSAY